MTKQQALGRMWHRTEKDISKATGEQREKLVKHLALIYLRYLESVGIKP